MYLRPKTGGIKYEIDLLRRSDLIRAKGRWVTNEIIALDVPVK